MYDLCMQMHLLSLYMQATCSMNILDRRENRPPFQIFADPMNWFFWNLQKSDHPRGRTCLKESESSIGWVGWPRTLTKQRNTEVIRNSSMAWCKMQHRLWNHYKNGYCPCLQIKTIDMRKHRIEKFQNRNTFCNSSSSNR